MTLDTQKLLAFAKAEAQTDGEKELCKLWERIFGEHPEKPFVELSQPSEK